MKRSRTVVAALWTVGIAALASCGGRAELYDDYDAGLADSAPPPPPRKGPHKPAKPPPSDSGGIPRFADSAPDSGGSHHGRDAASPLDASVAVDAPIADGARRDGGTANADGAAPAVVDCSCPPDTYSLDGTFGPDTLHFTSANPLTLYCAETTVQMEHPPCSEVYSLTACGFEVAKPPCVYLSIDRVRGPLIGFYVDSTGQTWNLADATMTFDEAGRVSTGSFTATFKHPADTVILTASGTFRACDALFPACEG